MGELGAFLKIERHGARYRDPRERARDYREFLTPLPDAELRAQGARCMECGVPFCHNGCPLGNLIPDWNDLVYRERWEAAIEQLHATNNFPEFTGRLCPAPCEAACVLEIREGDAVTIKQIEQAIIDRAWGEGWVKPRPPRRETGQSVAVVGSGPAGMAAAQQLRRAGHRVVLFERDESAGRPRALRRAGLQDREVGRRASRLAVARGGRGAALRRGRGQGRERAGAARRVRRDRARHGRTRAARPPGARPRARRDPLRDGVPLPAQPLRGARARARAERAGAAHGGRDHGRRQARGGDRRRRHRRGLRRQRAARGRDLDRPARAPAATAGASSRPAHALARVAAQAAPLLCDGRGAVARPRRAGLLDHHDRVRSRARTARWAR